MAYTAYDRLGIPPEHRDKLTPEAPVATRMAIARGIAPVPPDVLMNMAFVLTGDLDRKVSRAAQRTLRELPEEALVRAINQSSHPKLLEFFAFNRQDDDKLMEAVYLVSNATDQTAIAIAERATGNVLETVLRNQERLLITPDVYLALRRNPACTPSDLERVATFLSLHHCLPKVPVAVAEPATPAAGAADGQPEGPPDPATALRLTVEAEVDAALMGLPSPLSNPEVADRLRLSRRQRQALGEFGGGFTFDAARDSDWGFHLDLIRETDGEGAAEELNLTERIGKMTPGQKIKLAYLGNGESRKILLRDSNKVVVIAVIRSGRMTENEILAAAGNRNLARDVFREISMNKEAIRKYPVKLALANNPKCPLNVAMPLLRDLQKSDLERIGRNKNVSSVLSGMASKMAKGNA